MVEWSGIKSIINVSAPKTKIPEALELNGKTITNPAKIANSFNNFFGSIAQKVENNIITTHKSFTDYLKTPNEKSLFLTPTTANEIKNIINELNSKKTSGPGSIPTEILKLTNNIISKPLSEIINLSFESGIFPSMLKCSKIIPIYKKGENTSINSYRPISLLSNISKIIEKLIHSRTYSFLNKYKCIYDLQFGFRNRHSTNHALIQITEKIRKAEDDNNFACGVFVDLQKAFDTVNHNILLQKLKYYGIRGTPLAWFTSFLQQRTQTVSINGDLSEKLTVTHGVPQGSVLGPLLFLLYINDLHLAIQHSVIHHFADDTNMLLVGKSLKKIKKYINHDMSLLCHWLKANKLSLNTSKTEIILFRSQHKQINKKLNFRLSGQKIKLSKSVKYLGLILDEYLTWESHINFLKAKLSRSVGMLAKIRHYVPQETLKTIFFAIFNSHISYGAQIWSLEWFESYLTGRQQLTLLNNVESDLLHEDAYGVPQGSVLGPLLFLLYINDIKSVIQNSYCHLYADDTIIVKSASDPDSLISSLERELLNVDQWLSINKMTVNTKKTEVIFFGNKSRLKKLDNKTVKYLGTPLERKKEAKYLGVIFDEKMQWSSQISNITKKVNFKLGKIKSVASFLTSHTKKLLVNALVMPYFHYCSPAWSSAAPFRLRKVDKKVVDASNFLGRKDNYSIYNVINKDMSLLIFKALNNLAPNYICSKINMARNSHSHNTRGAAKNHL